MHANPRIRVHLTGSVADSILFLAKSFSRINTLIAGTLEQENNVCFRLNYRQFRDFEKSKSKMTVCQYLKQVLQLIPKLGPIRAHRISQKYSSLARLLEAIQASRGSDVDYVILQDQEKYQERLARKEKVKKQLVEVLGQKTYFQVLALLGFDLE